jgi:uncharacterized protein (DUF1684 family)
VHSLAKIAFSVSLATLFACGGSVGIGVGGAGVGVSASKDSYQQEIEDWHSGRISRLTSETGWLTLVGLFPIADGTYTFGGADDNDLVFPGNAPAHAGRLAVTDGKVHLDVADGVTMTHDGAPVTRIPLASDADGSPTEIKMGTYDFYVIDRPGSLYLRVKDSASVVRTSFKGIDRYPVDKKWRVAVRLDPYDPPRRITIPNVMGFQETTDCRGALVFSIDGKEYRLEPDSEGNGEMFIVFGDATSGHETYGGGRMIYIPSPDENGNTFIDFNRAYNPPCAFTPYATCPLPRQENVLPIAIKAGEKNWEHESH